MVTRYVLIPDGLDERWLCDSMAKDVGELVEQMATMNGKRCVGRFDGERVVMYAMLTFQSDLQALTWEECQAAFPGKLVRGLESWRGVTAAQLAAAAAERAEKAASGLQEPQRGKDPRKGQPGWSGPTDDLEFPEVAASEPKASKESRPAPRPESNPYPSSNGHGKNKLVVDHLRKTPGMDRKDLCRVIYGKSGPSDLGKLNSMLVYLQKLGKVTRTPGKQDWRVLEVPKREKVAV